MNYVILDLEWNSVFSKRKCKYLNEIFEFGAVKLNENLETADTFSALIKPVVSTEMNQYVTKLTDRTFEELANSPHIFETVLDEFADFLGDSILMTWSNSDILALMDNKKYFMSGNKLSFVKYYCDIQSYCERVLDMVSESKKLSLPDCAELLNIEVGDGLHTALYDAKLTAECFRRLFKDTLFSEFIEDYSVLYKKLTFKTRYIDDINKLGAKRKEMFFDCPYCGYRCVQKSNWNIRNKGFRAHFLCPNCKKEFFGYVKVKEKYEGVFISKNLKEANRDTSLTDLNT